MSAPQLPPAATPQSSRSGAAWVWILVLPFGGALLGFFVGAVLAYVSPKKFESRTVVQVNVQGAGTRNMDTLSALIVSAGNLEWVSERLDLPSRWLLDGDAVVEVLTAASEAEVITGTDLIQIRVRHTNPQDARDVADAIVEAFQVREAERVREAVSRVLDAYREELAAQEERVEDLRKVVEAIRLQESEGLDEAQRELAQAMKLKESLQLQVSSKRIELKIARSPATIHEEARIGKTPVSPRINLYLLTGVATGAGGGLLLGLLIAISGGRRRS